MGNHYLSRNPYPTVASTMKFSMAISSGLFCGLLITEAIRLWTIDPYQAYAAAILAVFLFMVSFTFYKDAGV